MRDAPRAEIVRRGGRSLGGVEASALTAVPVGGGVVDAFAREVVDDQERREADQLVERRTERRDVMENAARDHRVERPGVVETVERHAAVERPLGGNRVDREHAVAGSGECRRDAAVRAAADLEDTGGGGRELRERVLGETGQLGAIPRAPRPRGGAATALGAFGLADLVVGHRPLLERVVAGGGLARAELAQLGRLDVAVAAVEARAARMEHAGRRRRDRRRNVAGQHDPLAAAGRRAGHGRQERGRVRCSGCS